ncbi:MAG: hypothetical protein OEQ53_12910 [Saprospiraceae bacterium]|nr:hypothetical protein [Saprospiraceae bacterium]
MRILILLLCCLFLFGSCSKEYQIRHKEDKIIGAWEFDKVFYKKDHALFRDDITHEYRHDIIEFFPDYSAIYDDYSLETIFDGEWRLIVDDDYYYDEGSDLEFFIDAMFYDFLYGEDFSLFGSIDRLNRNKLHLEAHDRRGKFTFKLRRL